MTEEGGSKGSMGSMSSKGWEEKVQEVQWVQKVEDFRLPMLVFSPIIKVGEVGCKG